MRPIASRNGWLRRYCASLARRIGMMTKPHARLSFALLAVTILAGCDYLPFGYTPIKDIVAAPASFEGKEVKLKGKVKEITKLPIVNLQWFVLQDDSGEISVSTQGNLPSVNDRVKLKGVVKSAVIIGGKSLG